MHTTYPTIETVESASMYDLLGWQLRLPSPADDRQLEVLNRVMARLREKREEDPAHYTECSKSLTR